MRVLVLLLSLAHADTSIRTQSDFDLIAQSCALLKAKTAPQKLLETIGARDIAYWKNGWNGKLSHSRFLLANAGGGPIALGVHFELPAFAKISKKELERFEAASQCRLFYRPPGDFGDPTWPAHLAVLSR